MGELLGLVFIVGSVVFFVELIKEVKRIAVALEKLAGIPPPDFSKPSVE